MKSTSDMVVIGDTQVKKDVPTDHLDALARYIWHHKVGHVIHIGDNWDFPALNFYAKKIEMEGLRLIDDINAGFDALSIIPNYIQKKNCIAKKRKYKPSLDFLMGNHEDRLLRFINDHPIMEGVIDIQELVEMAGWDFNQYLQPLWINHIAFNHYMQHAFSGKAIGGTIENKLNKINHSFVHGHQQQYQYGRRQQLTGKPHFGACAGAFYQHDEDYRGANNTEIRGFVHLKAFTNRYGYLDYDVDFVSLERLMEMY